MAGLFARRILLALLILAGVLAGAAPARAEQQRAVLDVSINGVPHSQSIVVMDDGQVWIDLESLTSAGVKVPGGDRRPWKDRTLVRLGSLAPRITLPAGRGRARAAPHGAAVAPPGHARRSDRRSVPKASNTTTRRARS